MAGIKGNLNFENSDNVEFLLSTEGDVNSQRFIDISKNRFPITTNGNTKITELDVNYGYSVYFDGSGDQLTVPASSSLDLTGDFTIEFWVNAQASSYMVCNGTQSGSGCWYFYFNASTGVITYAMAISTWAGLVITTPNNSMTTTTWTHIALTRAGSSFKLFVNGVVKGSSTNSGSLINTGRVTQIGYFTQSTGTSYLTGYLSNLRIIKGTAIYTDNFTPPSGRLSAISGTSLLTCQGNIIKDNSVNNFTITKNGNATEYFFGPEKIKKSVAYFDGVGDSITLSSSALLVPNSGDFTWECWFYLEASPPANGSPLLFNPTNNGLSIAIRQDNKIWARRSNVSDVCSSSSTVALHTWYHVSVARQGTAFKMFINGVVQASVTDSTNFPAGTIYVGIDLGGTSTFKGYISNYRFVKGTAVYTSNFTPPSIFNKPLKYITYKKDKNLSNVEFLIKSSSAPTTTSFVDSSLNNLTVTNNSSVTVSSAQSKFNSKSINLTGSNYLSIAANSRFLLGTNNFTIECWFYVTTLATTQSLIVSHQIGGMFNIGINTSGRPYASVNVSGGSSTSYAGLTCTSSQVVINTWYHLAVVRNTTSLDIFLNGIKDQTSYNIGTSVVGSYGGNKPIYIGAGADTTTKMTGYIDNVRYTVGIARYTENFLVPNTEFSGAR